MEKPANTANVIAPNAAEAEDAVLGSILINPDVMDFVAGILSEKDFFLVRNGLIWNAIQALYQRGDAIDNVTVVYELEAQKTLEEIGGSAAITRLINSTPTYDHAETYARLVQHASVRRKMINAAGEIATLMLTENSTIEDLVGKSHTLLTEASQVDNNAGFTFMSEIASTNFDHVEAQYNGKGEPLGIPTGLKDLDAKLSGNGFQRGKLYIGAARPGMGKTAWAMGAAVNAAKLGKHVAVISKEMTKEDLHFRILAGETGITATTLKAGQLKGDEWERFAEATARTSTLSIAIDDDGIATIEQLEAKIIRLYREWGVDLVIVDYLQLLYTDDGDDNRNQEIAKISRKLKQLAMELKIPIVALSQLNRKVEERKDKRPNLADLRDSGALEQDADLVMFIYREGYYDENSQRPNEADFIIGKQRDGEQNITVPIFWISSLTKFTDLQKQSINLEGF